ncbi:MAG: hypothetical protein ACRDIB_03155, partial [Ardenticatenaceae bacterium]
VLLSGGGQLEIWDYYDRSALPRYPMPATRPIDEAATGARLEEIAARHDDLYALWWAEQEGDPTGIIPRWLDRHAFEAGSRWFGNVRFTTYRLDEPPPPQPLDVLLTLPGTDEMLHLLGASVDPLTVTAGDVIAIQSQWAAGASVPVILFVHLLDEGNHVVGQYDGTGGAPPVPLWDGEETLRMGVRVPHGTIPGEHTLVLGAYHAESGQRFIAEGSAADTIVLATIPVEAPTVPPDAAALGLHPDERRYVTFGDVTLLGAQANRLGFDHAPDTPLAPGDPLSLRLYWRAEQPSPTILPLILRLLDSQSRVAAEWPLDPTEGRFPPDQWRQAELVRDSQVRFLPAVLDPGIYRLILASERAEALLASVVIHE